MNALAVDGTQLRDILGLLGAPSEPTEATTARVDELARWVGPLPEETRQFLLTPVELWNANADHPHLEPDFLGRLPDVDAFLASLTQSYQGRFNATVHFMGLYPLGVQLNRGDYMYAMAILEPYRDQLGGVMYYDEREVGSWGASISQFLVSAVGELWTYLDGAFDGEEPPEHIDLSDVEDCFALAGYRFGDQPPRSQPLADAIEQAYEAHWRGRLGSMSRWWVNSFVSGQVGAFELTKIPTPRDWDRERERVSRTYHDAMYWLVAHMLLDNRDELADCVALVADHPSELVHRVAEHFRRTPDLGERWVASREALFAAARQGSSGVVARARQ